MEPDTGIHRRGTGRSLYFQVSGFCRRTTIHGLSHMYQSKTLKRRLFWLVVFLLGFTATIIHLTFHARQFLESPTIITMDHEGAEFEFPDVTICSQTPTTGRFYERGTDRFPNVQFGLTEMDFLLYPLYNQTYHSMHSLPYKEEIRLHKRLIQHQLASMPTKHKGFSLADLVIKCDYHKTNCRGNFTLVQSPYYLNCYTFQPFERNIKTTRPEDGLVLLLYTGNKHKNRLVSDPSVINGSSRPNNRQREVDTDWFARILLPEYEPAGVKIVIHERGAFPSPRSTGSIVGPGQFSEVEIGMIQEKKLNKAASPCLEDQEPKVWLLASVDELGWPEFREFNAEPGDCAYAQQQRDMHSECGCTSHHMPLQRDHGLFGAIDRGDRVGWCYNTTSLFLDLGLYPEVSPAAPPTARAWRDPGELIELSRATIQASDANRQLAERYQRRVRCHDRMLGKFGDPHYSVYRPCPATEKAFACQSNQYSAIQSAADWPRHSDIQEIIEDDILPALRLPNGSYQPLVHDLFDFNAAGDWTAGAELLRRNFVKLQMHPIEVQVDVHKEEPAYSIWEALGELGGIIGLWLGVSFLGVIEVFEFVVDLVKTARQASLSKPGGSGERAIEAPACHPSNGDMPLGAKKKRQGSADEENGEAPTLLLTPRDDDDPDKS